MVVVAVVAVAVVVEVNVAEVNVTEACLIRIIYKGVEEGRE